MPGIWNKFLVILNMEPPLCGAALSDMRHTAADEGSHRARISVKKADPGAATV